MEGQASLVQGPGSGAGGWGTAGGCNVSSLDCSPSPKLLKRITNLEFVDMSDLLPETWQVEEAESSRGRSRRTMVSDIHLWTECFTVYAAVLSKKFPSMAPPSSSSI